MRLDTGIELNELEVYTVWSFWEKRRKIMQPYKPPELKSLWRHILDAIKEWKNQCTQVH